MRAKRIALLPRDPFCLFVYWDVSASERVLVLRELGPRAQGARLVLRVLADAGGVAERVETEVEVPPGADRLYVAVADDDTDYAVTLGLLSPGGPFIPLALSDIVRTPPASPSADIAVEWARLLPLPGDGLSPLEPIESVDGPPVEQGPDGRTRQGEEHRGPCARLRRCASAIPAEASPLRVIGRRPPPLSGGPGRHLPAPHSSADRHGR